MIKSTADGYMYITKIGNQTFEMCFDEIDYNEKTNTVYWNVSMICYSKRKEKDMYLSDETGMTKMTGKNPMATIAHAVKAFNLLEDKIYFEADNVNNVILVGWLDSKRRDVYARYLLKHGYSYGVYEGKKHLMKKIAQKDFD